MLAHLEAALSHAGRHEADGLVVVHGDACLPNLMIAPDSMRPTGVIDLGRLGVADRHQDLALLSRSISAEHMNLQFTRTHAAPVLAGTDPELIEFYRLLDEFV